MFAKVVHRQLRSRDVALAMVDGEVMAGTIELRAKRQKFEAMSSKAAREAKDLRNQILLEQAAVEKRRGTKVSSSGNSSYGGAPQRGKKKKIAIAASDVLQDYKVVKEVAVQVGERELSQRIPACHQDVQFDAVLGCIKAAMVNLDLEMRPKLKLLKATVEPYQQRGVFAEKSIEKGTILLAPCSMHIAKLVPGKAYQDSAVDLGIVKSPWGSFSWRFVVMSPKASEKEMVSLFWFVKDAKHHELANITLTVKTVDHYGIQVQVPMMKAKKSIEASTELKICREKIEV